MRKRKRNMMYVEKSKRELGGPKYVSRVEPVKIEEETKKIDYKKPELVAESDPLDRGGRALGCPINKGDIRICQRLNIMCMVPHLR